MEFTRAPGPECGVEWVKRRGRPEPGPGVDGPREGRVRAGGGGERSASPWSEAPKSVGSNGETVFRLKGERAFEVDVWTFNRRCRLL